MSAIDWIVLFVTLLVIVVYGVYKTGRNQKIDSYLRDNKAAKWWTVGLSVMATQASAITFLSTPGQAFSSGMGFVQFYFGLPIAIVIICLFFIPMYSQLNVYTAYELLEKRFDLKTRLLTAFLFLFQRGMAAGITIYAPAIVFSTVLGVSLGSMVILIGGLVIVYTVSGGTKAVNITQKWQMLIIFLGLNIAFYLILQKLPADLTVVEGLKIAGLTDRMDIINPTFDLNNRYTLWSGLIGGTFLALSYFGTDQSQVQRYLSGASIQESRIGLLFNALLKVPMQFFILLVGIMVFVFYQFNSSPAFFNTQLTERIIASGSPHVNQYTELIKEYETIERQKIAAAKNLNKEWTAGHRSAYQDVANQEKEKRQAIANFIGLHFPEEENNDKDYVFIHFILNNLPTGLIGLLLAVFFCAAMSSTASELNALSTTTLVDFYDRLSSTTMTDVQQLRIAKLLTFVWGLVAIAFASFASLYENLIEFVNIIGSLFYGTILGIFLCAMFLKKHLRASAVFWGALVAEMMVVYIYLFHSADIAYLWLNFVGACLVIMLSFLLSRILFKR